MLWGNLKICPYIKLKFYVLKHIGKSFTMCDLKDTYSGLKMCFFSSPLLQKLMSFVNIVNSLWSTTRFTYSVYRGGDQDRLNVFSIRFSGGWCSSSLRSILFLGLFTYYSEHPYISFSCLRVLFFLWRLVSPSIHPDGTPRERSPDYNPQLWVNTNLHPVNLDGRDVFYPWESPDIRYPFLLDFSDGNSCPFVFIEIDRIRPKIHPPFFPRRTFLNSSTWTEGYVRS